MLICMQKKTTSLLDSEGKKITSSPMLFWRYCKDIQTSYLGTFGMPDYTHPKL